MANDLPLPDNLEIRHGENMSEVGPEAKQYYLPEEDAQIIEGVHIQRFDYRTKPDDIEAAGLLINIGLDKETGDYHLFMHTMGINSDDGLIGGLDYERTIKSDGERVEDIEKVPERIFDAMNTYLNQNH